jgi:hypothetical protein
MLVSPHDLLHRVLEPGRHQQWPDPDLHRVLGDTGHSVRGPHGHERREGQHESAQCRRERGGLDQSSDMADNLLNEERRCRLGLEVQ